MSDDVFEAKVEIVNQISSDGESGTLILYLGFEDMTDEEAEVAWVRAGGDWFDANLACYCEHDCCGHRFFYPPVLHRTTDGAIFITQGWGINI